MISVQLNYIANTPDIPNQMFTEQLITKQLTFNSNQNSPSFTSSLRAATHPHSSMDFQYEICNAFMRYTGEKLHAKEAKLMEDSRIFMENFTPSQNKDIDYRKTLDTSSEENKDISIFTEQQKSFSNNRKSRILHSSKSNQANLNEYMKEILMKCSEECNAFVTGIVAEYKKMNSKIKFNTSRERVFLRKQEAQDKYHEECIILKQKIEYQKASIESLHSQIEMLKQKNKSLLAGINQNVYGSATSQKFVEINHKVYKDIKNFLADKEAFITSKTQKIEKIESQIMKIMENLLGDKKCDKCCQILRRLKDSIIRFKKYLEGEEKEIEKLYEKYKKTMYSMKSKTFA